MENFLISIIIPSYNRFITLNRTILSIKNQTYKNIEIIVVNDGSTDERYYSEKFEGITLINLPENSRKKFGFVNIGYVINVGIKACNGTYIGWIGDDDIFLPTKIEEQLKVMTENNVLMSCTDSYSFYIDFNYNDIESYKNKRYIGDNCIQHFRNLYDIQNLPTQLTYYYLTKVNPIIASSVVIHKSILDIVGYFKETQDVVGQEDYDFWKRILQKIDYTYFIDKPLVAYDMSHGALNNN